MAKLTGSKFTVEGFPEQASWIGKFFSSLNQFIGETLAAFNNGITVSENLYQELREVKFVNSSGNFPLKFVSKFSSLPKSVQIIYCYNETDGTTQTITTLPVWTYTNGQISISSITGLTASKTYLIRVHVIYG